MKALNLPSSITRINISLQYVTIYLPNKINALQAVNFVN